MGLNDHAHRDGVAGETRVIVDAELLHDTLPVFLNGFNANTQFGRDLLVGLPFGNQLENSHFARAQAETLLAALFPWLRRRARTGLKKVFPF